MKRFRSQLPGIKLLAMAFVGLGIVCGCRDRAGYAPRNGDIVFQSITASSQSKPIELATHSDFSHVGIIYLKDTVAMVIEAVHPVRVTLLSEWIPRNKDNHYEVKRLREADALLTEEVMARMVNLAQSFLGRDYDSYFAWNDDKMYCSELVWKVFKRGAGVELCPLKRFSDYDFSETVVQRELAERYGHNIPMNEAVVAPADIFNSPLLTTVYIQ